MLLPYQNYRMKCWNRQNDINIPKWKQFLQWILFSVLALLLREDELKKILWKWFIICQYFLLKPNLFIRVRQLLNQIISQKVYQVFPFYQAYRPYFKKICKLSSKSVAYADLIILSLVVYFLLSLTGKLISGAFPHIYTRLCVRTSAVAKNNFFSIKKIIYRGRVGVGVQEIGLSESTQKIFKSHRTTKARSNSQLIPRFL